MLRLSKRTVRYDRIFSLQSKPTVCINAVNLPDAEDLSATHHQASESGEHPNINILLRLFIRYLIFNCIR
jgi:hypothetical protein